MKPSIDQALSECRGIIFSLVKRFLKVSHMEPHDIYQEAYLGFCNAYKDYSPEKGELKTLVYTYTKQAIMNAIYYKGMHIKTHTSKSEMGWVCDNKNFSLKNLLFEISEDARTVIKLVLDKEGEPQDIKRGVKNFLKDLGWTGAQIMETFSEIMRALRT